MPAVFVYVDGFNFYYGALRGTPYKWLNPVELAKRLLPPGNTVARLKYFTARVSGAADPDAPRRQHKYLLALSTLSEVEIRYGRFLAKTIWRPLANLPVAAAQINAPVPVTLHEGTHVVDGGSLSAPSTLVVGSYPAKGAARRKKRPGRPSPDALVIEAHCMEEKGSDVNLAAHLLNDAWKSSFDAAMVISNDTDLIEPIRMVTVDLSKPVFVVCPGRWPMAPVWRRSPHTSDEFTRPCSPRRNFRLRYRERLLRNRRAGSRSCRCASPLGIASWRNLWRTVK